jgi:hypothetical protein
VQRAQRDAADGAVRPFDANDGPLSLVGRRRICEALLRRQGRPVHVRVLRLLPALAEAPQPLRRQARLRDDGKRDPARGITRRKVSFETVPRSRRARPRAWRCSTVSRGDIRT